ncbi:MAG: HAMP domain-containing sensor histidine kinase [bacterium]
MKKSPEKILDEKQIKNLLKYVAFLDKEKAKIAARLLIANAKILFQAHEKTDANKKLRKRSEEIEKRHAIQISKQIAKLLISNTALVQETMQKVKKTNELITVNEELKKIKDDYLSIVIHEIKTPLVPIKSQLQLLLAGDYGELNGEQREAVEMIYRNEENLNRLSMEILTISKIRSGRFDLHLQLLSATKIFEEIVKEFEAVSITKKITFTHSIQAGLPNISADKIRLIEAIRILLDNAFKFTPEGNSVNLDIKRTDRNLIVSVSDTGIGIESINFEKIFSLFFQISNELTRKYGGNGLGLAIAKGIVEAHGGKIWVESNGLGKGSTFTFSIPITNKIVKRKLIIKTKNYANRK